MHPTSPKDNSPNFALTAFSEVLQGKFSDITQMSDTHLATDIYDAAFCLLDRTYALGSGVRYEERWRSRAASAPASADGDRKPMWPSGRIRTTPPVGTPARAGSMSGSWETRTSPDQRRSRRAREAASAAGPKTSTWCDVPPIRVQSG